MSKLTLKEEKELLELQRELSDHRHALFIQEQEFARRSEQIAHDHKLEQQRIFNAEQRKNEENVYKHKMEFLKHSKAIRR